MNDAATSDSDSSAHEGRSDYTATYSPEDNKLRLYSVGRLDAPTYARVKEAGFRWAPKQGFFVAPMWTPDREDLLIELAGEIGDEDTSLVDRAEERADRFGNYSDSRSRDAESARKGVAAIAEHIPFGQPILVGHHSERHARKDAQRIEAGMRKAVKMWDTAEYWKDRAAAALGHAKYKERADVRARRVKGLEADKRKRERAIAEARDALKLWQRDGLTLEQAKAIANCNYVSRCFPLADFPRDPPASQYEGSMSLWSALDGGVISTVQAREIAVRVYNRSLARVSRWEAHYTHRIAYERAMLGEQGGLVAERVAVEVGGRVLIRGEWLVITRVNKSGGQIVSVTTNARYVRVRGIEEVTEYQAPSAEQVAKVKAVTKVAPMSNFPGEGFVHITQAQWDAISKDYRGTRTAGATETVGRHRVRVALGCFVLQGEKDDNKRHSYPFVFITDAKRVDPPIAVGLAGVKAEPLPVPVPASVESRPVYQAPQPNDFDKLREQLREGVQVVSAPQLFPTPPELAARMVALADVQIGMRVLEPSAGTGRILSALPGVSPFPGQRQTALDVVAVEINRSLAASLELSGLAGAVKCADFLGCNGDLGQFDRVLMNPPFVNGQDIEHIEHALQMLKPGGRLVAICANGPRQNQRLRPLVEQYGGAWEVLPGDTFKESGTGVRAAMLSFSV
jgi:protein-L-isoaspartate O-methyltransferase